MNSISLSCSTYTTVAIAYERWTNYHDDVSVEKDKSLPSLIFAHWSRGLDINQLVLRKTVSTLIVLVTGEIITSIDFPPHH